MKYIYILDYNRGCCEIHWFSGDPEEWLSNNGYDFDNIHWMVTEQPDLKIEI